MKKLIITLTILSFLNLIGCYYQEQMNPGEYKFDENSTMKITTKDTVYNFNGDDYHLGNDTLFATILKSVDDRTKLKLKRNIPVETIEMIEVERINYFGTTLIILPFVLAVVFMIGLGQMN